MLGTQLAASRFPSRIDRFQKPVRDPALTAPLFAPYTEQPLYILRRNLPRLPEEGQHGRCRGIIRITRQVRPVPAASASLWHCLVTHLFNK